MDPYKPLAIPRQFDWYGQCIAAEFLELTKRALKGEMTPEVYTTRSSQLTRATERLTQSTAADCYNALKADGWDELLVQFDNYPRLVDNVMWYNEELAKHLEATKPKSIKERIASVFK